MSRSTDEFLAEEFVVEDAPESDASLIFTGASDPPPFSRTGATPVPPPPPPRWRPYAVAVAAGLLCAGATGTAIVKLSPRAAGASPRPAAALDTPARAAAAKADARSALQQGLTADAVQAAARAVALDPGDADGWLILGAGFDQADARDKARDAFATCVKVATRGPRGECEALLR